MEYLFFDTETTGIPVNRYAPLTDFANWPRLVQLAWVRTDETGQILDEFETIVKPSGFSIPPEAANIHGISTERALAEGMALEQALGTMEAKLGLERLTLVAHNLDFDEKGLAVEWLRLNRPEVKDRFLSLPRRCTMLETMYFCNLPGKWGKPKWPKLEELHIKLFGLGIPDAHDALVDVRATVKCFFELRRQGVLK